MMRAACLPACALSALPQQGDAAATLAIWHCALRQTCLPDTSCRQHDTRRTLSELTEADGNARYFHLGPRVPEAAGGLFFDGAWRWQDGALPEASDRTGRLQLPNADAAGGMRAHLYRPGAELGHGSGCPRVDFDCSQVMY